MSETEFTPGPWDYERVLDPDDVQRPWIGRLDECRFTAIACGNDQAEANANAALIASAPDHALVCWAMCIQDATWEEWTPFDGRGEFCFAGIRYCTKLDDFGAPVLTPALRAALTEARSEYCQRAAKARAGGAS